MSESEWDEPGYAVIISDRDTELSERMQGTYHMRADGDQATMTFIPFGDGKFKIPTAGIACRLRYCPATSGPVEDERMFVPQAGDTIALKAEPSA